MKHEARLARLERTAVRAKWPNRVFVAPPGWNEINDPEPWGSDQPQFVVEFVPANRERKRA